MASTLYLETHSTDPAYNLAFEEYVLANFRQGNILILWQNDNAVIIGRNQNTAEEINQAFIDRHGIRVIRRNTGGGAVYHDMGNLNYSFIADADSIDKEAIRYFLEPVVGALRDLGLDAECSGRNDILVSGKKVSGTAQQLSKGRLLHHGTLLFDSNPDMISGALNPDPTKFQSKSVKSVRSRVGNIREHLNGDMDIHRFWQHLKTRLLGSDFTEITLTDADLSAISELKATKYDTWQWNYGKSPKFQLRTKKRFSGGLLDIHLSVAGGCISDIQIFGDFLALSPISDLESALLGCQSHRDALLTALRDLDLSKYLGSITAEELVETILSNE